MDETDIQIKSEPTAYDAPTIVQNCDVVKHEVEDVQCRSLKEEVSEESSNSDIDSLSEEWEPKFVAPNELDSGETNEERVSDEALIESNLPTVHGHRKTCDFCDYQTEAISDLKDHIATHLKCEAYDPESSPLATVNQDGHGSVGDKLMSTIHDENSHSSEHREEDEIKCGLCKDPFASYSDLDNHAQIHVKENSECESRHKISGDCANGKRFTCNFCNKRLSTRYNLRVHIENHSNPKRFECDICSSRFSIRRTLQKHKMIHTGEKPYQCHLCDYGCKAKELLTMHIRNHTGEKPFKCEMCDKRFVIKSNLKSHIATHTQEKPFKCELCDRRFSKNCILKYHTQTIHTGQNPHKCEVCNSKFPTQFKLHQHSTVHTGEKPFQCDLCGFRCRIKKQLTLHISKHTGEKPFKCKICDKRFSVKSTLKSHIVTHVEEMEFKCKFCGRRFRTKYHLQYHVQDEHTNEKPFQCDSCDYKCARKLRLTAHVRNRHGKDLFKCKVCEKGFTRRSNLNNHRKIHAGESTSSM